MNIYLEVKAFGGSSIKANLMHMRAVATRVGILLRCEMNGTAYTVFPDGRVTEFQTRSEDVQRRRDEPDDRRGDEILGGATR